MTEATDSTNGTDTGGATDSRGARPWVWSALRGSIVFALLGLLLWRQSVVGTLAAESLGGGALTYGVGRASAVPIALAGFLLLFTGLGRALLIVAVGGFVLLLLSTDAAYLRFFERPFSIDLMVLIEQAWSVRESVSRLLGPLDLVAWFAVAGLAVADVMLRRRARGTWRSRVAGLVLLAGAAAPIADAWRTLGGEGAGLHGVFADLQTVRSHGALLYHVADVGRSVRRRGARELDPHREEALLGAIARRHRLNRVTSPLEGVAAGRNVILLQLESIEAFVVGRSVAGGALTPNLDRLRAEALVFDHCLDLTGAGRTSDAEFMVQTSLRPDPLRPIAYASASTRYTGMARRLAEDGYRTLTLHAYQPWFWNRAVMHPLYGIQELWFDETFHDGEQLFLGLGDTDFLTQAAARLARVPEPFFAHCITLSCHHPFGTVPSHLESFDVGFEDDPVVAGYLRLVRYTDEAVGEFVRGLEETGEFERSLLVIYGDHVSGVPSESRRRLAQRFGVELESFSSQRVPLLVLVPGSDAVITAERPRVRDASCSLMDVPPTVMHLLGREIPPGWLGVHLLVDPAARPVLPHRRGLGFSSASRVTDDPAAARDTGEWRAAQEELRFARAMRTYDGQERAAALAPGDLERLAAAAPAPFERPADDRAWELRHETTARRLEGGARVLPFLPFAPAPVELELVLTNHADGPQPYRLDTFTADGLAAATREGRLDTGEQRTLALSKDEGLRESASFWGRLTAADDVDATMVLRSAYGETRRKPIAETASRSTLVGTAAGIETALLVVVNPTDGPIDMNARIEVDGQPGRDVRRRLEAHRAFGTRVALDQTDGLVRLTVDADGAVARVLRFSDGGRRVR